jgi:vacuolar iron transporter family protein
MSTERLFTRLRRSVRGAAGTIVFGMEDGTVSIFGLVFGVAATTTSSLAVLIAGTTGAAAAAVSMMAGAYLDAETRRDEQAAREGCERCGPAAGPGSLDELLAQRLDASGLSHELRAALARAVAANPAARRGLLQALEGAGGEPVNPLQQALWMLVADFLSAAVPIVPFMLLPVPPARVVSATITLALLVALGVGRARIGRRAVLRTVLQTVGMGVAAALAGVGIGMLIQRAFSA